MAALAVACAAPRAVPVTAPAPPPLSEAARLVTRADQLARDGQAQLARQLYEEVVRQHRDDPARARALLGLARLHIDPQSGLRDLPAADAAFARLVAEYGHGPWAEEARAWRAALQDLATREAELARLRGDLDRLKGDLERGRADAGRMRLEAERIREDRDRLRTDLERLRQLDMELERRR
jgi:hypothetical protein